MKQYLKLLVFLLLNLFLILNHIAQSTPAAGSPMDAAHGSEHGAITDGHLNSSENRSDITSRTGTQSPTAPGPYTIIDLGTLGGVRSYALDINDIGQVVGQSDTETERHAYLWQNGAMTGLGTLYGGYASEALAINDVGQVVGWESFGQPGDIYNRAILWSNGEMTDLGTLGGRDSTAQDINDAGAVVGGADDSSETGYAFLWQEGVMSSLGTLGGNSSFAHGINDLGQVVGVAYTATSNGLHAFLWQNGIMTDLGTLGGIYSSAQAINNAGQVAGWASDANAYPFAVIWQNGQSITLPTGSDSYAFDINEAGQVVGTMYDEIPYWNAFLYDGGAVYDLNDLLPAGSDWQLTEATGINDKGEIVGWGEAPDGGERAFLMRPQCGVDEDPPPVDQDDDGLKDCIELLQTGTDPENPDTDGDSLLDSWEAPPNVEGAGFDLDGDGQVDASRDEVFGPYGEFMSPPSPLHKDLYVEVDWQDCSLGNCPELPPSVVTAAIIASCLTPAGSIYCLPSVLAALTELDPMHHMPDLPDMKGTKDVMAAFAAAPVSNPNGQAGILLHVLVDENVTHAPNCDQDISAVRAQHFGTPAQRNNSQVMAAKESVFRYVWSGHSTFDDEEFNPGGCKTPSFWEIQLSGVGVGPLPAYDHTPFGDANIGGQDILVTLSPLWICPENKGPIVAGIQLGFVDLCFRGMMPGIFPADVPVAGQLKQFQAPIHKLLGLPTDEASSQLWARSLMHLLGHSLGLASDDHVHNHPPLPGVDTNGDGVLQRRPPDTYATWSNLQFDATQIGSPALMESVPGNDYDTLVAQDLDGDGIPALTDNCLGLANPSQADLDEDGQGDVCDYDADGDGQPNELPSAPQGPVLDNQAGALTQEEISLDVHPFDTDDDGRDNANDADDDGDGIADGADNCNLVANEDQADTDGDGIGDACDADADDDDFPSLVELISASDPLNLASVPEFIGRENACSDGIDNDLDGLTDSADEGCIDTDGDTAPDFVDNCPGVPNHNWADSDLDGVGNACEMFEAYLPVFPYHMSE